MATINEIKQQAAAIKNATQVGENTAERVGGALAGLAELAEQQDSKLSDLSYTYDCSEKGTIIFSSLNDAISAIPDNIKKPYLKIRCIIGKKENGYQTFLLKANVWSAITRNWEKWIFHLMAIRCVKMLAWQNMLLQMLISMHILLQIFQQVHI